MEDEYTVKTDAFNGKVVKSVTFNWTGTADIHFTDGSVLVIEEMGQAGYMSMTGRGPDGAEIAYNNPWARVR
jgi:hypothetical protein